MGMACNILLTRVCRALLLLVVWVGIIAQSNAVTTSDDSMCTVRGRVYTERDWYGYLVTKAFHRDFAKVQYSISYPVIESPVNLLIYYDDQVKQLRPSMTCQERLRVLPEDNNQVIPLITSSVNTTSSPDSSGCSVVVNNRSLEQFYVCRGERIFRSSVPRTWFFGIGRCGHRSARQLSLSYVFNITGYYGECEEDPLVKDTGAGFTGSQQDTEDSGRDKFKYLSISLGIVAGLALILAAVFFGLWFLGLRQAAKGKGSSVTSSQATMTVNDDIFYVNPSLSEQGQPDYGHSMASSSENYYEVIPERRSYESINTQGGMPRHHHHHLHHALRGAHHPLHHMHQMAASAHHKGYPMLEDYPPPPYQPPRGLHRQHPGSLHRQQQRPLMHHAYHSSMVPTSAPLDLLTSAPTSSSANLGDAGIAAPPNSMMMMMMSSPPSSSSGSGTHPSLSPFVTSPQVPSTSSSVAVPSLAAALAAPPGHSETSA